MKRHVRIALTALLTLGCPISSHAQLDTLLKELGGQKSSKEKPKGSKTETLIFGGLKTLKGLMPIGYKEELAIGGAVALEAVARFGGLWENADVEKYVATVGAAVALTSDRPEIPYYFGILNASEPNAFACPGGYVFVSRGLLSRVRNEAELAGILGHEIAHVSKKHALDAIRRSKAIAGLSEVTLTALDQDPKMFDSVVKETMAMIFDRGLSRDDEMEADKVGTDFAYRVGYNPRGLSDFLGILETISGQQKGSGVFKTHPSPKERISHLSKTLATPSYRQGLTLPTLADRATQSLTSVRL